MLAERLSEGRRRVRKDLIDKSDLAFGVVLRDAAVATARG